jgi:hypothetical protein
MRSPWSLCFCGWAPPEVNGEGEHLKHLRCLEPLLCRRVLLNSNPYPLSFSSCFDTFMICSSTQSACEGGVITGLAHAVVGRQCNTGRCFPRRRGKKDGMQAVLDQPELHVVCIHFPAMGATRPSLTTLSCATLRSTPREPRRISANWWCGHSALAVGFRKAFWRGDSPTLSEWQWASKARVLEEKAGPSRAGSDGLGVVESSSGRAGDGCMWVRERLGILLSSSFPVRPAHSPSLLLPFAPFLLPCPFPYTLSHPALAHSPLPPSSRTALPPPRRPPCPAPWPGRRSPSPSPLPAGQLPSRRPEIHATGQTLSEWRWACRLSRVGESRWAVHDDARLTYVGRCWA